MAHASNVAALDIISRYTKYTAETARHEILSVPAAYIPIDTVEDALPQKNSRAATVLPFSIAEGLQLNFPL